MVNQDSLVTVIITTYKRPPEMVKRALDSVLRQSHRELEIVVVDDSPATYEHRLDVKNMALAFGDPRIKYLENETNVGACASRNRAIRESVGEFVIYVDDDDELLSDCIEKRLTGFDSEKVGLVYSDCIYVDEKAGKEYRSNQVKVRGYVYEQLIIENFILAFPMLRRECFLTSGMFDESLPASQDWDMWLRVSKDYEINYIDEALSRVHLHQNERISTNPHKKIIGLEKIYELNKEYIEQTPHTAYLKVKELVPYYIAAGEIRKGWKMCNKSIKIEPKNVKGNVFTLLLAGWGTCKYIFRKREL